MPTVPSPHCSQAPQPFGDRDWAPHTRYQRQLQWVRFETWAAQERRTPLPATAETVSEYLRRLIRLGRRAETLRVHLAAISAAHEDAGLPNPCSSRAVKKIIADMMQRPTNVERWSAPPRPLTAEDLHRIQESAYLPRTRSNGRSETGEYAQQRGAVDVALVSVMRDALLRRSEAAAMSWGDVERCADGSGRLTVLTDDVPERRHLTPDTLAALERIRPATVTADRRVFDLVPHSIGRRIQAAARAAGLGDGYTSESCRLGMLEDLRALGRALERGMVNIMPELSAYEHAEIVAAVGSDDWMASELRVDVRETLPGLNTVAVHAGPVYVGYVQPALTERRYEVYGMGEPLTPTHLDATPTLAEGVALLVTWFKER